MTALDQSRNSGGLVDGIMALRKTRVQPNELSLSQLAEITSYTTGYLGTLTRQKGLKFVERTGKKYVTWQDWISFQEARSKPYFNKKPKRLRSPQENGDGTS